MTAIWKLMLFTLAVLAILAIAAMFGMPGARDGERHLAGNYYFSYSGGNQNTITDERGGVASFVIFGKVEEFVVHGNGIFVTRRPVIGRNVGENRWDTVLSDTCEYYRIDVPQREVHGPFTLADVKDRREWTFLKAAPLNADFGATKCKLDAIRN